jgi:cephalosporin-C deacetylase-like acetyl esterase
MLLSFLLVASLWGWPSVAGAAGLEGRPREEEPLLFALRDTWNVGATDTLRPEVHRLLRDREVTLYWVRFDSHRSRLGPVRIFGYLAVPHVKAGQRAPALVAIHGGGGRADKGRALAGARHGFVTFALDLPGKGPRRARSQSTGPDMTVQNIFAVRDPKENYLVHALRATQRAITYLQTRPEVDPARIGVLGVSWGGVLALLTATTDPRVKAAVDVFGAGYIDQWSTWIGYLARLPGEEVRYFRRHLDPASYAPWCRTPVFVVGTTNDHCFWLPALMATYQLLAGPRYLLIRPNLGHQIDDLAHRAAWRWLQAQLGLADRSALARHLTCQFVQSGTTLQARIAVRGKQVPTRLWLTRTTPCGSWLRQRWDTCDAHLGPAGVGLVAWPAKENEFYAFATACYGDGLALSTPVHTVWRLCFQSATRWVDVPGLSPGVRMVPVGLLEAGVPRPTDQHARSQAAGVVAIEGSLYEPLRQAAARAGARLGIADGIVQVWPSAPARCLAVVPASKHWQGLGGANHLGSGPGASLGLSRRSGSKSRAWGPAPAPSVASSPGKLPRHKHLQLRPCAYHHRHKSLVHS